MLCLARSVANSLEKDKADQSFISASPEEQIEIATAYAQYAVRKFEQFAARYQTCPDTRDAFREEVFAGLQQ